MFPRTKEESLFKESPSILATVLGCDFPYGKSKTAKLWEKAEIEVIKKSFSENMKLGAT